MKIIKTFQLLDLLLQSALIAAVTFCSFFSLIGPDNNLIMGLFFLLLLGGWQLFSALLLGFGLNDHYRRIYLITAITFSSLFFSVGYILNQLDLGNNNDFIEIAFFVAIFISFVAGVIYMIYSYKNYCLAGKQATHDIA
ncbi:hypothetical protein [Flavilitoribacter nigricans]|uniref:Uncharacterized protein n=1 Tax=Flavilitoribacter nigricans (strain ATCC 23147 / DSM 23189 / NBRC 102662 / NCIMB 1420 / SS-2) TaxID=1122177 RepID=A0A2D0N553_FLAN2|nr:hypothetical protein [Flavilitoribacter nigricans]PHN03672.1 hypothetical protein CRP01_25820 [Flavilitoribacter nigricans DSM 23189 = NBRC 102662]